MQCTCKYHNINIFCTSYHIKSSDVPKLPLLDNLTFSLNDFSFFKYVSPRIKVIRLLHTHHCPLTWPNVVTDKFFGLYISYVCRVKAILPDSKVQNIVGKKHNILLAKCNPYSMNNNIIRRCSTAAVWQ